MKKLFILITFLMCFSVVCFSAEKKVYTGNEFGGETDEFIIDPAEKDYEQFYKVVVYYDNKNQRVKTVYYLSEAVQTESGYCQQEEIYSDGRLSEYRMIYTKTAAEKFGVTKVVEKINSNNQTTEVMYYNGNDVATTAADSFTLKYPLYSLKYLENEFDFNKGSKNSKNDRYYLSSKYYLGRSFVQFKNDYYELDELDKKVIKYYADYMSNPEMANLYTAKAKVTSEGKTYTVYIQKNLIPYIHKDLKCLMAYGLMGINEQLVLLMAEYSEVQ